VTDVPEAGMEPQVPRVTMTYPLLNAAKEVVFLVSGADKAEALRRAFGDEPDPASPAAHVRPRTGRLLVLCDEAAAGA
jgi:6-phosphogluconolactonase